MAIQPYLTAVGEWMVRGVLQDRHGEFCLVRSAAQTVLKSLSQECSEIVFVYVCVVCESGTRV